MLDLLAMASVWVASVAVVIAGLALLNELPKRTVCLWVNLKKLLLIVFLAGGVCNVLAPVYGWAWSVYGGHLVTIAVGFWIAARALRSYFRRVAQYLDLEDMFDLTGE